MSNRIASLNQIINATNTNLFNTYTSGSGVGAVSISNRRALIKRASLNSGTIKNPAKGVCSGFCAGGQIQPPPGQTFHILPPK